MASAGARGDLTNPQHWDRAHQDAIFTLAQLSEFPQFPWLPIVLEHLQPYRGQRFLELGCSPGQISAMICRRIPLRAEGVDFSDSAWLYLKNMETAGVTDARLHRGDFRAFSPEAPYDVVASFGLVEHFEDPQEVLNHHHRLLRPGGLCIVELPRIRGLLYLHKWLFDRPNLRRHNVRTMRREVFRQFARRTGQEIVFLDIVGGPQVWGCDDSGPPWLRNARRRLALGFKRFVAERLRPHIRPGHPWFAPWLLYIGRKPVAG